MAGMETASPDGRDVFEYDVAEMEPAELPLLFSSWARSYRYATKQTRRAPKSLYFRAERDLIDDILARYPLLLVARVGNVVLGWVCAEATDPGIIVHYLFVKPQYQRSGIARKLFAVALRRLDRDAGPGLYTTHVPDRYRALVERYELEHVEPSRALRMGGASRRAC